MDKFLDLIEKSSILIESGTTESVEQMFTHHINQQIKRSSFILNAL